MVEQKHLELLQEQINSIEKIYESMNFVELRQWREETLMVLDILISEESKYYNNFENIIFRSSVTKMRNPAENQRRDQDAMRRGLEKARASLKAILFGIKKGLL